MPSEAHPAERLEELLGREEGKLYSCAAAGVWKGGKKLFGKYVGSTESGGRRRPGKECMFDLASITKVFTSTLIMRACGEGLLGLDSTVGSIIPAVSDRRLRKRTVAELLSHTSGLPALRNSMKRCTSRSSVLRVLNSVSAGRSGAPVYSDLGFMLLGEIAEAACGEREDELLQKHIAGRLGLRRTMYNPPAGECFAATGLSPIRRRKLVGETHNEVTARMDGVAGHAGIFSTLDELHAFASTLLSDYSEGKGILLGRREIRKMARPVSEVFGINYGLGIMVRTTSAPGYRPSRGIAFGHTGHTGTSMWIEPGRDVVSILLTNRDEVDGSLTRMQEVRNEFHTLAAALA